MTFNNNLRQFGIKVWQYRKTSCYLNKDNVTHGRRNMTTWMFISNKGFIVSSNFIMTSLNFI